MQGNQDFELCRIVQNLGRDNLVVGYLIISKGVAVIELWEREANSCWHGNDASVSAQWKDRIFLATACIPLHFKSGSSGDDGDNSSGERRVGENNLKRNHDNLY
ncbi:hypothetical protein Pyn_25708 [Prunus yedoensis var. nudiflora]|uniref:Uncharacterized protein n=1 Tax=Prunus yedoensis var. nudiflora TaxID=2094558 RepID=A0A314YV78_PRUYE|nr:hypothetical protein Pyn_25708 [Prunus yedoensis var. nudiflora]